MKIDSWKKVIALNLSGVYACRLTNCEQMEKNGGGNIVKFASVSRYSSCFLLSSAYTASKHGVVGLTKNMRRKRSTTVTKLLHIRLQCQ